MNKLITATATVFIVAAGATACGASSGGSGAGSSGGTGGAPYVITDNVPAPGEHLYIPAGRYVALGDSFSSGEGVQPFHPETDHAGLFGTKDTCHRSFSAYSQILRKVAKNPEAPRPQSDKDFVACSGAQIQALWNWNVDNTSEPPQLDRLNIKAVESNGHPGGPVGLVTMTMAGNDVGFGPIIQQCLRRVQGWAAWLLPGAAVLGSGSCQSPDVQHQLDVNLNWLDGTRADNHNPNNLEQVYKGLRRDAPHARILILGYPHEFKPGYSHDCQHIDQADLGWANSQLTDRLDNVIQANIKAANANIEYVQTVTYFQNYPQCGGPGASAFYGVDPNIFPDWQGFFHPNAWGQQLLAQAVLDKLENPAPTASTSPSPSPSATSTSSCSSETFLSVARRSYGKSLIPSGTPTCADGYAYEDFLPGSGGQQAPFFFKQDASGNWALIEGGSAVPRIACTTIPPSVMTKLGYQCSPIALIPSPATPSPSGSIAPGHATPQEAVDGFFQARFQGNETLACSYASPASRANCSSQNSQEPAITGNIAFNGADVSGQFALVELTGHLCYPGRACESNTNPLLNMPASPASFQQVYLALVKSTTYTFSPYPCIRVGGMWYINLGP
jgi:lysophospholipase L1-like esterase